MGFLKAWLRAGWWTWARRILLAGRLASRGALSRAPAPDPLALRHRSRQLHRPPSRHRRLHHLPQPLVAARRLVVAPPRLLAAQPQPNASARADHARAAAQTFFFALGFCLAFAAWGIYLWPTPARLRARFVILFGSLAAIGCAYGLSSFPSAARLPLVLLGLPSRSADALSSPTRPMSRPESASADHPLISLRLLDIHNENFTKLVESRAGIAAERERARRAEKAAKAEKAKARIVADTDPLTRLANRRAFLRPRAARPPRSRRRAAASRSRWSISTVSSRSTTRSAMPPATRC